MPRQLHLKGFRRQRLDLCSKQLPATEQMSKDAKAQLYSAHHHVAHLRSYLGAVCSSNRGCRRRCCSALAALQPAHADPNAQQEKPSCHGYAYNDQRGRQGRLAAVCAACRRSCLLWCTASVAAAAAAAPTDPDDGLCTCRRTAAGSCARAMGGSALQVGWQSCSLTCRVQEHHVSGCALDEPLLVQQLAHCPVLQDVGQQPILRAGGLAAPARTTAGGGFVSQVGSAHVQRLAAILQRSTANQLARNPLACAGRSSPDDHTAQASVAGVASRQPVVGSSTKVSTCSTISESGQGVQVCTRNPAAALLKGAWL